MAKRIQILLAMAALMTGHAGCNDPYSQKRIERRQQNRERFIKGVVESEKRRPGKLERTTEMFEDMHQRKFEQFERVQTEIGYYLW